MLSQLIVRASWWRLIATIVLTCSVWCTIWFYDWTEHNLGPDYATAYVIISSVCSFAAFIWLVRAYYAANEERARAERTKVKAAERIEFAAEEERRNVERATRVKERKARGEETPLELVRAWRPTPDSDVLVQVDDGVEVFTCSGGYRGYKRIDGKALTPQQQIEVDEWGSAEFRTKRRIPPTAL